MKKYGMIGMLLALAAVVGIAAAGTGRQNCGERCGNCDKRGAAGSYSRMYDATKTETVTGDVVSVDQVSPGGRASGSCSRPAVGQ